MWPVARILLTKSPRILLTKRVVKLIGKKCLNRELAPIGKSRYQIDKILLSS
jgi:hypothetical protein